MNGDGTGQPENSDAKNNADLAEVERLRKEADQAKMRANQLENELAERKRAEDEARAAKLKENEEYKTLAEEREAKLKELEAERAKEASAQVAAKAKAEVLGAYPKEIAELVDAAGVDLTDGTEEAKTAFKARVEAIASKVTLPSPVRGNNAAPRSDAEPKKELILDGMKRGSDAAKHDYFKNHPAVEQMRQMAGVRRQG